MTLRTVVFERNTTHAGVTALIATRCYPQLLPENATFPAVVYFAVSADNTVYRTHSNVNDPTAREVSRVQMDAYAETSDGAAELADQLRDAWDGYKDECTVGRAFQANRIETYETGIKKYRHIIDVMIEHSVP